MKKCQGEGHGSCKRCNELGIWNMAWMCFLYEVEGHDGCYCEKHAKELEQNENIHT